MKEKLCLMCGKPTDGEWYHTQCRALKNQAANKMGKIASGIQTQRRKHGKQNFTEPSNGTS